MAIGITIKPIATPRNAIQPDAAPTRNPKRSIFHPPQHTTLVERHSCSRMTFYLSTSAPMAGSSETSAQRRRTAQSAQTRRRILRATRDLVPRAGATLPVAEIARVAGVAVQTIYDHFGSKGGLLMATVNDAQQSSGLFAAFEDVFRSADGEAAMRRMLAATVGMWHGAWPFVEFTVRARRSDRVVAAAMGDLDRLRFAHFEAIVQRLEDEGRLRHGLSVTAATAEAFALSTATVYEELAVRRTMSLEDAISA